MPCPSGIHQGQPLIRSHRKCPMIAKHPVMVNFVHQPGWVKEDPDTLYNSILPGSLWGCFQKRLPFETIHDTKKFCPHQRGKASSNPMKIWMGIEKVEETQIFSLFWRWDIYLLPPSDIRTPGSQVCGLELNCTSCFPGSPACCGILQHSWSSKPILLMNPLIDPTGSVSLKEMPLRP